MYAFIIKLTFWLTASASGCSAVQAHGWMSENITEVNSISEHSIVSGGKVNIAAAAPANKALSNWWQHSGPIHTHGGKLSDKISRICLSSVYFQATKQTCSTSMVHQVPAVFPPRFYKGQFWSDGTSDIWLSACFFVCFFKILAWEKRKMLFNLIPIMYNCRKYERTFLLPTYLHWHI